MPIPFLGILAVAGGLIGAGKVIDSMDTMDRAKSINREAKRIAEKASEKRDDAREATNKALAKLGKTKISIMAGNISRFAENYSRIKNIRLKDSAGLKELVDFDPNGKDFLEMKNAGFEAKELAAGGVGSIAVGALTAAGAYSAVGMLGAASTGTAISALSGAAATNATLAWLGGGALSIGGGGMALGTVVLGGLVAAPALIVAGLFMGSKADEALSKAKSQRDEARKYKQDVDNLCTVMEAISERANQIRILLEDLDDEFDSLVNKMIDIIEVSGNDWQQYSKDEKIFIGIVINVAKTIKTVIDTPLLTEDGTFRDNETAELIFNFGRQAI